MKKGWTGSTLIALTLTAASHALAAGAPATQDVAAPAPASVFETATVHARPLSSATASVTVVDRPAIERSGARSVADVLCQVPGVFVLRNGTRGGITTGFVRGGEPNFTMVLLDGVPLNDSTDQYGGAFHLDSIDVVDVERVEVLRGPASFFYGSTALAGVVNIVTRKGHEAEAGVHAAIELGEDSIADVAAGVSGKPNHGSNGSYTLGISHAAEESRIGDDSFEQVAVRGGYHVRLGRDSELSLSLRVADWEGDDYPEASGGPVLGSGELRHSEHLELSLGAALTLGPATRGQHKLTLGVYGHELERSSPAIGFRVPAATEDTSFSRVNLDWVTLLRSSSRSRVTLGADLDHESGSNESVLMLPPAFGGATPGDYERSRFTGGVYAAWSRESGPWLLDASARVDLPEGRGAELSPRLAARYRPAGGATSFHGSVSRGFKLPSFFALASPAALGGNPDLDPETSVGIDAGVGRRFDRTGIDLDLTLFAARYRDLVDFDFPTFRFVNRNEVDAYGAELALDWRIGKRWSFAAGVTRTEIDNASGAEPLRQRPEWLGSLQIFWQALPVVLVGLDGQSVSSYYDQQDPAPGRDRVPGYELLGLTATWKLNHSWSLRARIENLADTDYETLIGFPGPDRTARIGLRYRPSGGGT